MSAGAHGHAEAFREVVKIMSLRQADFARGMTHLMDAPPGEAGVYRIALEAGHVTITATPMEPVQLGGGLLSLPRCRVVLVFRAVPAGAQAAFLARFERTFQRAGG